MKESVSVRFISKTTVWESETLNSDDHGFSYYVWHLFFNLEFQYLVNIVTKVLR